MAPIRSPKPFSYYGQLFHLSGFLLVLVTLAFSFGWLGLDQSKASGTIIEAGDLLGQFTPTANDSASLRFNTSAANNNGGGVIGRYGVNAPGGTAYDPTDNRLFMSDTSNNRVLVFNLADTDADYYEADYVLGQPNFTSNSDGGIATSLRGPTGLAFDDTNDRLFVSDTGNHRVLVYDVRPSGSGSSTACGVATTGIANGMSASCAFGSSDLTGGAPSSNQAAAHDPRGLAYDETNGHLYVAQLDYNRVTVFHADSADITSNGMDAFHVYGQLDFDGTSFGWDDPIAGTAPSARSLGFPFGVAHDAATDLLYVADSFNGRVVVFDTSTVEVVTAGDNALYALGKESLTAFNWDDPNDAGGPVDETPTQDSLLTPSGLALDTTNKLLYVSDTTYHRLTVFDVRSAGSGNQTNCGTGTTGIATGMDASCVFGQGNDFTSTTSGTTVSKFNEPTYMTYIGTGTVLYVSDKSNNRVLSFDVSPLANGPDANNNFGQVTITTTYTFGSTPLFGSNSVNSAAPVVNKVGFSSPQGLALDSDNHRLFVSDSGNHRVLVFELNADDTPVDNQADNVLGQADFDDTGSATSASRLAGPTGLAYWESPGGIEYLFVADRENNRVAVYDVTAITNGEAAIAFIGQVDSNSAAAMTTQTGLSAPNDVAVKGEDSELYVADKNNNRVLVYDLTVLATGMPAMAVIGQSSYITSTASTTAGGLEEPSGVLYDESGDALFVADSRQNRVLRYDGSTISSGLLGQAANGVLGQTLFTTKTSSVSQAGLKTPNDMFLDQENAKLYVIGQDSRVTVYDISTLTNGENAEAVIGQINYTGSDTGTSESLLLNPIFGVFNPADHSFYLSDSSNSRVLVFNLIQLSTLTVNNGLQGMAYSQALSTTLGQGATSFEIVSGAMPSGLTFNSSGIVGTPSVGGSLNFTVRAIDSIGSGGFVSNKRSYTMLIDNNAGTGGGPSCNDPEASNNGQQSNCVYDPPIITITLPTSGSTYTSSTSTVALGGTATDRGQITSVVYSLNGASPVSASGTTNWSVPNVTLLPGPNTITVTARNNHSLVAIASITIIYNATVINPGTPTCADDPILPGCGPIDPVDPVCTDPSAQNFGLIGACIPPVVVINNPVNPGGSTIDICDNIPGNQDSVPQGMRETDGICLAIDPPEIPATNEPEIPTTQLPQGFVEGAKNFARIGLIVGALSTFFGGLFGGAITLSELALAPMRLWSLFLGAFGFRRKLKHWGVVYDSVTKQPLDPAYVSLFDADGKEVATAITDLEGRYGFLVKPGQYRIEAHKTNYIFPSRKLAGKTSDEIYGELYFGEYFTIAQEGQVVAKNIPLDQENFDWNEYVKHERKLTKSHLLRTRIIGFFSSLLFYGGLISSLVALYLSVNIGSILAVSLYAVLLFLRLVVIRKPAYGLVSAFGEPMPYGVVKIYNAGLGTLMSTRVLDRYGRYYALAPKGSYYVTVDRKNDDQSYTSLHKSSPFDSNHGVINRKIKI